MRKSVERQLMNTLGNAEKISDTFRFNTHQIHAALRIHNPRTNGSWIKIGNEEAHDFRVGGGGDDIRMPFNVLILPFDDESVANHDVSCHMPKSLLDAARP